MTQLASPLKTTRAAEHALSALSPFELKDYLIKLAKSNEQQSTAMMLNAGRGNPNWIATEPREAFFLLGKFALAEGRRIRDEGILAGTPDKPGIGDRFKSFLVTERDSPGAVFLGKVYEYGKHTASTQMPGSTSLPNPCSATTIRFLRGCWCTARRSSRTTW